MRRLRVVVFAWGAISWALLWWIDLSPVIPTSFLMVVALLTPTAYAVSLAALLDPKLQHSKWVRVLPVIGLVCGALILVLYGPTLVVTVGILTIFPFIRRLRRNWKSVFTEPVTNAILILCAAYWAIWNSNYLALHFVGTRSIDPWLRSSDELIYGRLTGHSIDYTNFFPIVRSDIGFAALEQGYAFLFAEIIAVTFLLARDARLVLQYLTTLIACYIIGLAVFLVFPAVGPCLYFPASFDPAFNWSQTYAFMHSSYLEFVGVSRGGRSVTGYGYFVALPSLHSAVAVLIQISVRCSPMTFWLLLPINVAIVLSTALLGYHYVLDTVAGLALAPLIFAIVSRLRGHT